MKSAFSALILGLFLFACSSDSTAPHIQPSDISLTVQATVSGTAVAAMTLEVIVPGITNPIIQNLSISNGVASGTVAVPAGSDRTFTVRAFDGNALETHRGSVTTSVRGGMNPTISIALTALTGDLPITVTMGSYAISVTAESDTMQVGDTVTYTAAVMDADGDEVAFPELAWASENPVIASIDSMGQAVARRPGSTLITASFGGAVGAATLVVQ